MKTIQVDVWILVEESENVVIGLSREEIQDRYTEEVGDLQEARRIIKVALTVPVPEVVKLAAIISPEPTTGELTVN